MKKSRIAKHVKLKRSHWRVIALVVIVVAAFLLGTTRHHEAPVQSVTKAPVINLRAGEDSQALQGMVQAKNSRVAVDELPPSNGHITLGGTVDAVSNTNIDLKMDGGKVISFSLRKNAIVTSRSGSALKTSTPSKRLTIQDIKKGDKVTLQISVYSDDSFVVQQVRVY